MGPCQSTCSLLGTKAIKQRLFIGGGGNGIEESFQEVREETSGCLKAILCEVRGR